VDADGQIRLPELEAAITPRTVLIAIMAVNNETGVMQPLEAIGAIARAHNVLFFSDAAQAFGKLPLHVQQQSIDLLSLSAHKLCGPQGVGALYVRRKQPRVKLAAQAHGGGQEHGLRSGTLNLPGIVGLGKAAALCAELQPAEQERFAAFRQMLCDALVPAGAVVNGGGHVLPQILSLRFPGRLATGLLHDLQGRIDLTTGSACSSASLQPSHVLKAMGLTDDEARSTLRLSMGRFTTEADMAAAIGYLRAALHAQPPL
jgi:cysteine desulfurase